jgi:acetyltransferase-like isoleucine patch superfamily enzyme
MSQVSAKRARIGRGVKLGRGSRVEGDSVEIGDNVAIGDGTVIRAREVRIGWGSEIEDGCAVRKVSGAMESFVLGDNCFIGNHSNIASTRFSAGDYVSLHNHLFVNGTKPCTIGHNVWVGQNCVLNARETLTIGSGVGIGAYSSVWTHGAHGELIEGCLIHKAAPVTLEDDVWIVGSYNVVSPGVTVGKGTIVMTGSVVTKDVPPGTLVAGNPARDISDKLVPYRKVTLDEKFEMLKGFVADFVSGKEGARRRSDGWTAGKGKSSFKVRFVERYSVPGEEPDVPTLVFAKRFEGGRPGRLETVFDLSTKTYTKRRTDCEVGVIRSMLYSKARFIPRPE